MKENGGKGKEEYANMVKSEVRSGQESGETRERENNKVLPFTFLLSFPSFPFHHPFVTSLS